MGPRIVGEMVAVISLAKLVRLLVVNRPRTHKMDEFASRNGVYKTITIFRRFMLKSPTRIFSVQIEVCEITSRIRLKYERVLRPTLRLVATVALVENSID